jgi:sugar/nucleoside kinase (ribokinase family)
MLLEGLDEPDESDTSRPCAARVLEEAQSLGMLTSLDMVSDLSPRLHRVVAPTLRHVDFFIANELEAGALAEVAIRDESNHLLRNNFPQIAEVLFSKGVSRLVCIHAPEGGFWMEREGRPVFKPSLNVPPLHNKGTAGAGDAFCGGILYGLHEGWDEDRCLTLAVAHAAQSLSDPTTTGGLKRLDETLALVERFGYRE